MSLRTVHLIRIHRITMNGVRSSHSHARPFCLVSRFEKIKQTIEITDRPALIQPSLFRQITTIQSSGSNGTSNFDYEKLADETLESLHDDFESSLSESSVIQDFDISLSNGVLTIDINGVGTYVINKQTPNRQIWLSSPLSGPKRYDYLERDSHVLWIYRHDGVTLDQLLSQELSTITKNNVVVKVIKN